MFNSSFYVSSALPPTCHPLHVQNLGTFSLCSITTTVSLFVYRFTLKVWYMLWHTIYIINYRFYEPAPLEGTMRHWGSTEPPKRGPLQTNVQNICFGHWFVWRYQLWPPSRRGVNGAEPGRFRSKQAAQAPKTPTPKLPHCGREVLPVIKISPRRWASSFKRFPFACLSTWEKIC